ncbi:MAG: hypothetical protein FJ144_28145 [Deltaproteobacteria bacterium]|nr:hypothetical protein [Deltaproteobacteria bacterium]
MSRRLAALSASLVLLAAVPRDVRADVPRGSGGVLVRWTQLLGGDGDVDRGPSIEVYGDGTVLAHYPRYMKRAGTWSMRLTKAELEALVQSVANADVVAFDPSVARAEKERAVNAARVAGASKDGARRVFAVHDAATTRLELHLERAERTVPSGRSQAAVAKTIEWPALASDAARYPQASTIQGLASAERALTSLLERPELARFGDAPLACADRCRPSWRSSECSSRASTRTPAPSSSPAKRPASA